MLHNTVRFWQSRGMSRCDPSSKYDQSTFRDAIKVCTAGQVECELQSLAKALPPSELPLFVWCKKAVDEHLADDESARHIFCPDVEPFESDSDVERFHSDDRSWRRTKTGTRVLVVPESTKKHVVGVGQAGSQPVSQSDRQTQTKTMTNTKSQDLE